MRLKDKVAVITGAGQGIGKAYAKAFLGEGARVVIADYNEDRGQSALKDLQDLGDVIFVKTDVSDEASAESCATQTKSEFGGIDILVNNAALYYDIDLENQDIDYLKRVFDVNLHGCLIMARACAPSMVERGGGSIINQSSDAAYIYIRPPMGDEPAEFPGVGTSSYSQTKWGVVGLTKFLAGELGRWNIRVNCIAPGVTMTEATKKTVSEDLITMLTFMTPLRRTLQPEDLVGAAIFFAGGESALITGQVLCVDAGLQMPA